MAEYYAVLKKAVSSLDPSMAEARRTVYEKARNALIGQLKAIDPPLPTSEISRQRLELEEAIRKVEREASTAASAPPKVAAAPARAVAPPPQPEPEPAPPPPPPMQQAPPPMPEPAEEPVAEASPQDVFRRAIQEAEARGAAAAMRAPRQPAPTRPERAPIGDMVPDYEPGRGRFDRPPPEPSRERYDRVPPPEPPRDRNRYDRMPPPEPPAAAEPAYAPEPPAREPRLAPDYDYDWEEAPSSPGQGMPPPPPAMPQRSPFERSEQRPPSGGRRPRRRDRDYADQDDRDIAAREARPSRLPMILLTILFIAVIGGLGALAWSQRAVIKDLIAGFEGGKKTTATSGPSAPSAPPSTPTKDADRLLGPDAGRNVRVVDNNNPPAPTPDGSTPSLPGGGMQSAGPPSPTPVPVPVPMAAPTTTTGDDSLVAQKAVLYEEPVGGGAGSVSQTNASVTWQYVQSGPNGPEVVARLDIPDKGMKVRVSFRKNTDQTLPASHLVEIVIDTPANFAGKGIRGVPRLVMKETEDARGQPLVGASAKVADGFFWIALSSTDTDVANNVQLFRDRDWIDLPIVYETGQRAILTFEKGTPGQRVFERALAAWGSG